MELLHLVFGLQNRLQKAEYELDSMKKDTDAKFAKTESQYLAVRDDIKSLSAKMDEQIKKLHI